MVTSLMVSAMGDLMLVPNSGSLAYRETYNEATLTDLPIEIARPREILATISGKGWRLTARGADFILDNCPPNTQRARAVLERFIKG
jgi:hypothetical protein